MELFAFAVTLFVSAWCTTSTAAAYEEVHDAASTTTTRYLASTTPVNGTFTLVRGEEDDCTPVTAVVRSPVDDDCMRVAVADVLANMAPTFRYIDANDDPNNNTEMETAIGSIVVMGGVPGNPALNLSYACPPDGYNGFSRAAGSFCVVTPDTQLWATFTDYESKLLHSIRVVLSNSFPDVDTLRDNEPPFGTALFDFPEGLDLSGAAANDELAICEATDDPSLSSLCPELPAISGLNTKLQVTSYGYFGAKALGKTQIPGNWYQDDAQQLLAGITSPSSTGGLSDYYFNGSGFFLYSYNDPNNGPDTCVWLPFCDYECEVYNYDARFFDDLGTWNVTWKVNQDQFDTSYSKNDTRTVRAYFGNAIDAAGIFPCLMYTDLEQMAYLGLDKIGSADANLQPDYAYYWYTRYTVGPPAQEFLTPPDLCLASSESTTPNSTSTTTMPTASPTMSSPTMMSTSAGRSMAPVFIGFSLWVASGMFLLDSIAMW